MIETINGAGLSGMTGKAGKQVKNGLFAKLLAMLEKHGQASAGGLGKGQASAGGLGKGQASALIANKDNALLIEKGKQLLALAAHAKLNGKSNSSLSVKLDGQGDGKLNVALLQQGENTAAENTATPLISAHIMIDPAGADKKLATTGKSTVLLPIHKAEVSASGLNKSAEGKAANNIGLNLESGLRNESRLHNESQAAGQFSSALLTSASDKSPASTVMLASKAESPADASLLSKQFNKSTSALNHKPDVSSNMQPEMSKAGHVNILNQAADSEKVSPVMQAKQAMADKIDNQAKPEVNQLVAAMQVQKSKPVQVQAGQQLTTPAVTAFSGQSNMDAALADSGSQSSDRGQQEGRNQTIVGLDSKSSTATASSSSNFHNYLSQKAPPSMNMFDSMQHIAQSAKQGKTMLEIQLEPANMGKIQILLQSDAGKQLQVHMIVDQNATRANIEQHLPQLKTALAQQGFDLSGFSMGSQGQQNFSGNDNDKTTDLAEHGIDNEVALGTAHSLQVATENGLSIRV